MDEIKEMIQEAIREISKQYIKKYFLISYDAGLRDFNSTDFKEALTQLLIDERVEDLLSPTESTIVFSTLDRAKMAYQYWDYIIKNNFKDEKYYTPGLFYIVAEITKEATTNVALLGGKQNEELNMNYIEKVEKLKKIKK